MVYLCGAALSIGRFLHSSIQKRVYAYRVFPEVFFSDSVEGDPLSLYGVHRGSRFFIHKTYQYSLYPHFYTQFMHYYLRFRVCPLPC